MISRIIWICSILVYATAQTVEKEDDIKQLVHELQEINFKMDTKLSEQLKNFLHAVNMVQQEMDANFEAIFLKQQKDFKEFSEDIKNELASQITKNENCKSDFKLQLQKQDTQRQTELKELREETRNNMKQQRILAEKMREELKNELELINVKTLDLKNYSIEKFHMLDEQEKESKFHMEAIKNILQDLETESKLQLNDMKNELLDQGKELKLLMEAMKINLQDILEKKLEFQFEEIQNKLLDQGKESKLQLEAMQNYLQDQARESKLQMEDIKNKLLDQGNGSNLELKVMLNKLLDQEKESKLHIEAKQNDLLNLQKQQINQQTSLMNLTSEIHKEYSDRQVLYNNTRTYPSTCAQALNGGGTSGVYKLQIPQLNAVPFSVYCVEDPSGGAAWSIVQRRQDGSVDFYRDWSEYKKGFGNLNGEYFIGLDLLHLMTNATTNELWIELRDFENVKKYAKYSSFGIGNEKEAYILNKLGAYKGDVNDSFTYQKGSKFSTKDLDNDISYINCAVKYKGAWWYNSCYHSNLNGHYLNGSYSERLKGQGVTWTYWHGLQYSLKYTHMAIRPAKLQ